MNDIASKQIRMLPFHDAYLADLQCTLGDEFDPKYEKNLPSLNMQTRAYIDKSEVFEIADDEDYGIFKVIVVFGVRWCRDSNVPEEELDICALIESRFIAEYIVKEQTSQDTLDEVALSHVISDIWPYWRELLTSQCSRMHLTGVKIPANPKL